MWCYATELMLVVKRPETPGAGCGTVTASSVATIPGIAEMNPYEL